MSPDVADLLRLGRPAEAWIAPPKTRELREMTHKSRSTSSTRRFANSPRRMPVSMKSRKNGPVSTIGKIVSSRCRQQPFQLPGVEYRHRHLRHGWRSHVLHWASCNDPSSSKNAKKIRSAL